jgi:hypothetical protein
VGAPWVRTGASKLVTTSDNAPMDISQNCKTRALVFRVDIDLTYGWSKAGILRKPEKFSVGLDYSAPSG